MIVRAINIRQPWGFFITKLPPAHAKTIENRSWRLRGERGAPYTGPLVLVASATCSRDEFEAAIFFAWRSGGWKGDPPKYDALELGGIIGAVHVTGYVEPDQDGGPWHVPGNVGWKLEGAIALPFRPYRGKQGPFRIELTPAEADALRAAKLAA